MITDKDRNILLEIIVRMPWEQEPQRVCLTIGEHAGRCLSPLPANRDLPDAFGHVKLVAAIQAREQEAQRRALIQILSRDVAAKLTELIQKRDRVHGYKPA